MDGVLHLCSAVWISSTSFCFPLRGSVSPSQYPSVLRLSTFPVLIIVILNTLPDHSNSCVPSEPGADYFFVPMCLFWHAL